MSRIDKTSNIFAVFFFHHLGDCLAVILLAYLVFCMRMGMNMGYTKLFENSPYSILTMANILYVQYDQAHHHRQNQFIRCYELILGVCVISCAVFVVFFPEVQLNNNQKTSTESVERNDIERHTNIACKSTRFETFVI